MEPPPSLSPPAEHSEMEEDASVSVSDEVLRSEEAALDSFRTWRQVSHSNTTDLGRIALFSLPQVHLNMLTDNNIVNLPKLFGEKDQAIETNAKIFELIYGSTMRNYSKPDTTRLRGTATDDDMSKANDILKLLYRDWSKEAKDERAVSYNPVVIAAMKYLDASPYDRHQFSILVPGSSLGRLACELVYRGFTVTANEFVPQYYLAFDWLRFSSKQRDKTYELYPWIMSNSNHLSREDQMKCITIPDITMRGLIADSPASKVPFQERLQVHYGDFTKMISKYEFEGQYHAVATCWFIDTAKNFFDYIRNVRHCLKLGGIWINHGPLQWHFEESRRLTRDRKQWGKFELTNDEVLKLVEACGFEILEHRVTESGAFMQNPNSMQSVTWKLSFWVARKQ